MEYKNKNNIPKMEESLYLKYLFKWLSKTYNLSAIKISADLILHAKFLFILDSGV